MLRLACLAACTVFAIAPGAQESGAQESGAQEPGAQDTPAPSPAAQAQAQPAFAFLSQPPRGLPAMPAPKGYVPTEAMFHLGERLFGDGILSLDRSVSCATCHPPANGFANPAPRPAGVGGRQAPRHAPALWNRGWGVTQRWDGSSPDLETFVLEPIPHPDEMGLPLGEAIARLGDDARYRAEFERTFGASPDAVSLARALATYVRGIVAGDVAYDRFVGGAADALTVEQRTGLWIFESKGRCWQCHTPPLFTDEGFHNTGVGVRDGAPEPGRAAHTRNPADTGAWKTPTLRAVRATAPFMHDGSLATLADVVDFYARGGNANAHLDARMRPVELSPGERRALIAFLESL